VMVSATIVRAGQEAAVQTALAMVADATRPAWQRSAVLRGAEVALVPNTPMPGTVRRGAAPSISATAAATPGAPCPTCPGGRAGPGGGYAFDDARPQAAAPTAGGGRGGGPGGRGGGRGRGRGGPRLQLVGEPAAFATLAGGSDELASRAADVLARIEWPGKPGAASPATPLTAAEQQRFEAGREIYRNICQACHQPDGRGQERLAPSLIGSAIALGAPEIPVRVLLSGKEGPVGLMPPVGSVLSDEQIAGVLTYIRREWDQMGTPVDPAQVTTVRAQTASRTRPWTHDELIAMIKGAQ
jgi:mono/diheme cytochrome c family protein